LNTPTERAQQVIVKLLTLTPPFLSVTLKTVYKQYSNNLTDDDIVQGCNVIEALLHYIKEGGGDADTENNNSGE